MKNLQKEVAWVEKQFFLAECKRLAAEKRRVEKLQKRLKEEFQSLLDIEKKMHGALSKRALSKVKQEVQAEINRTKHISSLLKANEKHLKHHFVHDKQQLIRKEKEKLSLIRRGIVVI